MKFEKMISDAIDSYSTMTPYTYTHGVWVYFICDGEYVKIGVAKNIESRVKQLQTGNAKKLFVKCKIPCKTSVAAYFLENELHHLFSEYQLQGEWFDVLRFTEEYPLCNYSEERIDNCFKEEEAC